MRKEEGGKKSRSEERRVLAALQSDAVGAVSGERDRETRGGEKMISNGSEKKSEEKEK